MNLFLVQKLFLVILLFLISIRDLKAYKIPNEYILAVIGNWIFPYLLYHFIPNERLESAANAVSEFCDSAIGRELVSPMENVISAIIVTSLVLVIAILCDGLLKKKSLGGGDVKLIFAGSLYLGLDRSLYMIFLACVLGVIGSILRTVFYGKSYPPKKKGHLNQSIPFGPSIAASMVFLLIFP